MSCIGALLLVACGKVRQCGVYSLLVAPAWWRQHRDIDVTEVFFTCS